MRIAVVGTRGFPGIQGGIESHCEKLYTRLSKKGCEVFVYTRKPYVNSNLLTFKGVTLIPVNCPRSKFFETIFHTFKSIFEANKLNPDILHIHAIGPSLFTPLARILGMKVVVTNHGPEYKRKKWPLPAKIFLRFCEWMGMAFTNEIIAVTQDIARNIKSKFGRGAAVIPNGVEIPSLTDADKALIKFGLHEKRYILTVGRFVPEKGFDYLIDAFNKGAFENWKLVIIGDADHEDKYSRDLKIKVNRNSDVILTGFLSGRSLQELYSNAGLFVLPSYYEGLPIVLLEAMSYGLSCIASDIPANKNVPLDNDRFFKVGDAKSLKEKMKNIINKKWDEDDRKRQISMIAEKYNWGEIAKETLKVYKRVT
jgi:glycosyltransferase involved in cell wall biosynthesis